MTVLGLIPARGGSKGVPRKNARRLAGRPLLAYTAEAAHGARRLTRVVLSTDDPEIAEIGYQCGLDVPFVRPADLARDETPMLPVVLHAVGALAAAGERFEAVCLLQPTNPLRTAADIDGCIELLEMSGADAVFTVLPVPAEYNPHWVYFETTDATLALSTGALDPIPRRQELPAAYHREGSVYVTRTDVLVSKRSLYGERIVGYKLDPSRSVNIDGIDDWGRAERLLASEVV